MGQINYKNCSYSPTNIEIFQWGLWKLPDMLFKFFFSNKSQKKQSRKKSMGQGGFMKFAFSYQKQKNNEICQYGLEKLFHTGLVIIFQIHAQCTMLLNTGRFTLYTTYLLVFGSMIWMSRSVAAKYGTTINNFTTFFTKYKTFLLI